MDIFQFFARFHVLVLHLPIGILMLSALMELTSAYGKNGRSPLLNWIWFWGGVSAVGACILGWMLSQADGYNPDAVFMHRSFGISVAVCAFICWWVFKGKSAGNKAISTSLPVVQLLLLFLTGHYGANMTHGETYLVEYAPNSVRALAGLPPHAIPRPPVESLEQALVYEDIIEPMLQKRCTSCHNDSKQKGKLNLASLDGMKRGGRTGDTIISGNANESELYRRITLDHEEKEFMPAEGKKPLTDEQVAVIKWWIDAGAPTQGFASGLIHSKDNKTLISGLLGLNQNAFPPIPALSNQQISLLSEAGFVVKEIAQNNHYLDLDLSVSRAELSANGIALLNEVAANIAYLNLSKSHLSEPLISVLSQLTHLQKLRLDYTNIDSNGVEKLSSLDKLVYLNLYGTEVDNRVFEPLAKFSSLENVYLNETKVTQESVEQFRNSSGTQVNFIHRDNSPSSSDQKESD